MANIALNKPSGGQLILSPEDGTSTETVSIPAAGVMSANATTGKVLQVVNNTSYDTQTSLSAGSAASLSVSLTRKAADSYFIIQVGSTVYRATTSGWHYIGYRLNSNAIQWGKAKDASSWSPIGNNWKDYTSGNVGDTVTVAIWHNNTYSQTDQWQSEHITVWEVAA
jgi:hypothetical protein